MELDSVLYYVSNIGKIISVAVSVFTILWSIISIVKVFVEKLQLNVEQKDWEGMIATIDEFVKGVEQEFLGENGVGTEKKQEVVALLEQAGYSVDAVIDALIESAVYKNFNESKAAKK